MFNKLANYVIMTNPNEKDRDNKNCLGKLRAVGDKDKFTLYDNGENFNKLSSFSVTQLRIEHGSFFYRYEPCNVGNIRKMLVVLPNLLPASMT